MQRLIALVTNVQRANFIVPKTRTTEMEFKKRRRTMLIIIITIGVTPFISNELNDSVKGVENIF